MHSYVWDVTFRAERKRT